MAATRTSPTSRSPWPPGVLARLSTRRDEAVRRAEGSMLELGAWGRALSDIPAGARYDAIVSVVALPACADLPAAVAMLRNHLVSGGELHFVEPVGVPGAVGMMASLTSPLIGATAGLHLDRDVPSALRAGGLAVIDNERFAMPTAIWSLRHWVDGTARVELSAETGAER